MVFLIHLLTIASTKQHTNWFLWFPLYPPSNQKEGLTLFNSPLVTKCQSDNPSIWLLPHLTGITASPDLVFLFQLHSRPRPSGYIVLPSSRAILPCSLPSWTFYTSWFLCIKHPSSRSQRTGSFSLLSWIINSARKLSFASRAALAPLHTLSPAGVTPGNTSALWSSVFLHPP